VRGTEEIAFRTAYLITGDAAEADDVAQDAFVKAYYALARFRVERLFAPGCSRSSPTRPVTDERPSVAGSTWPSALLRIDPSTMRPHRRRKRS